MRVIDADPQRQRGRTRENPPEIVPQRLAPHRPAEKPDPGAEDHLDLGPEVQDRAKRQDLAQGRREIGVPVAHVFGALREGPEQALADRLGLADIRAQVADEEAPGGLAVQLVEQLAGPVRTPVVDEEEPRVGVLPGETPQRARSSLSASL